MQSLDSSLPVVSMYVPSAQSMQSDASSLPITSLYRPAEQLMDELEEEALDALSDALKASGGGVRVDLRGNGARGEAADRLARLGALVR